MTIESYLKSHPDGCYGNAIPRDGRHLIPEHGEGEGALLHLQGRGDEWALVVGTGDMDVEHYQGDEGEEG